MPVSHAQVDSWKEVKREGLLVREAEKYFGHLQRLQPCARYELLEAEISHRETFVGAEGADDAKARAQQMNRAVNSLVKEDRVWVIARKPGRKDKPVDVLATKEWALANGYKKLKPRSSARDEVAYCFAYIQALWEILREQQLPAEKFDQMATARALDSLQEI